MNLLAPLYRLADRARYRRHGDLGEYGEDQAHRYLRASGYVVVARNWSPPQGGGEIDIVARLGERVVFVEVKTRASGEFGGPERAIDEDKIVALRRAARDYRRRLGGEVEARFDAVLIVPGRVEHLEGVFEL